MALAEAVALSVAVYYSNSHQERHHFVVQLKHSVYFPDNSETPLDLRATRHTDIRRKIASFERAHWQTPSKLWFDEKSSGLEGEERPFFSLQEVFCVGPALDIVSCVHVWSASWSQKLREPLDIHYKCLVQFFGETSVCFHQLYVVFAWPSGAKRGISWNFGRPASTRVSVWSEKVNKYYWHQYLKSCMASFFSLSSSTACAASWNF